MALDYCNTDPLGDSDYIACPKDRLVGGSSQAIFLEVGHAITDPSDDTEITTALNNGSAHLVQQIAFWVDAASPIEQDSLVPCETSSLVNYDRTGGYVNPNVTNQNVSFHDNLFDGRTFGGVIFAGCGKDGITDKVYWINHPIKLKGSLIFPRPNSEFQRFEGTWAGRSMNNHTVHNVPPGIFD